MNYVNRTCKVTRARVSDVFGKLLCRAVAVTSATATKEVRVIIRELSGVRRVRMLVLSKTDQGIKRVLSDSCIKIPFKHAEVRNTPETNRG